MRRAIYNRILQKAQKRRTELSLCPPVLFYAIIIMKTAANFNKIEIISKKVQNFFCTLCVCYQLLFVVGFIGAVCGCRNLVFLKENNGEADRRGRGNECEIRNDHSQRAFAKDGAYAVLGIGVRKFCFASIIKARISQITIDKGRVVPCRF